MRVLVCGSREWKSEDWVRTVIRRLPDDSEVLHGAARGVDTMAERAAVERALRTRAFFADWNQYGKRAGILRNLAMLDERPDVVIAFWNGKSRGTLHTMKEADRRLIPLLMVRPHPECGVIESFYGDVPEVLR